ncbi:MAG: HD domain-containing protein [Planctomycetota bacterium]|nr:HD domain-containing protein [Planctomycetota bacterium]
MGKTTDFQETWVIETADLVIGSTLSFDLNDAKGAVLHKSGAPISRRLLDLLEKKGIRSVTVKGHQPVSDDFQSVLLSHYDSAKMDRLDQVFAECEASLRRFLQCLQQKRMGDTADLVLQVDQFMAQAKKDSSAAFAMLSSRIQASPPEIIDRITSRSTTLALMGVTTGVLMGLSREDCGLVGITGLLHDCSLLLHPEWFRNGAIIANPKVIEKFRNHPIESMELLKEIDGFDAEVLTAIAQVHEQFDGSGFPHGLSSGVPIAARVLNAADAYLNLVLPLFPTKRIVPADALAVLCHNAAKRRFDPKVVRSLIRGMSIYPIGSIVELDDQSEAIVVSSNSTNAMEPTVRHLNAENGAMDLSKSPRIIVGPSTRGDASVVRVARSSLNESLWRYDLETDAISSLREGRPEAGEVELACTIAASS